MLLLAVMVDYAAVTVVVAPNLAVYSRFFLVTGWTRLVLQTTS